MFGQENRKNSEVFISNLGQFNLSKENINELISKAKIAPRNRVRFCSHPSSDEKVHEMFIVHPKGAYVRPHKHLNKPESILIIEGEADYVIFDNEGNIKEKISMGSYQSDRPFYQSTREDVFHSLVIHSEWLVFLEVTQGPFKKEDTVFAEWSPREDESRKIIKFMKKIVGTSINE